MPIMPPNMTRLVIAPFYLMFGWHPRLPVDLVMCTEFEERDSVSTPQYIEELKAKLADACDIASRRRVRLLLQI